MRLVLKKEAGRAHIDAQAGNEDAPPIRQVPVEHAGGAGRKVEFDPVPEQVIGCETVDVEETPAICRCRRGRRTGAIRWIA